MKIQNEVSLKKIRRKLWLLGFFKIPLIGFLRPKLLSINSEEVKIRIKLNRRSKNHLNSMYFAALAVGADVAGGIHAFYFSEIYGVGMSFSFKAFDAQFLQRAESEIIFSSNQGELIRKTMELSYENESREECIVVVTAKNKNEEEVANFNMTLSIRVKR